MSTLPTDRLERELLIRRLIWSDLTAVVSTYVIKQLRAGKKVTPKTWGKVVDYISTVPVDPFLAQLHRTDKAS